MVFAGLLALGVSFRLPWWAPLWEAAAVGLIAAVVGLIRGEKPPRRRPGPIAIHAGEGPWSVRLDLAGPRPIVVVSVLRDALPLDLKAAHDLASGPMPTSVATGLTEEHARELADRLRHAGAEAAVV